ncbi:hypothetical protein MYX84_09190 [Acidobacteria bacterium AH-259-O06]|nr:hypothetical protein [Acidobacteria bacterium AH-259-O06]
MNNSVVAKRQSRWRSTCLVGAAIILVTAGVSTIQGRSGQGTGAEQRVESPVPSPPVPGKPSLAELDIAIKRGTDAFIREFVKTSYAAVSNGGYVDYKNAAGIIKHYGPDVYVASQLYLLTHFLMYYQDFGISRDDALLKDVHDWFVAQFDEEQGYWLWSHEGCLHPKGMIALANFSHTDLVEKAYEWALHAPFYLSTDLMFTMMKSGSIIQTLGDARISLTGKHEWEHGSPIPDAENSSKLLYALLKAGVPPTDKRVADLRGGIASYILATTKTVAAMGTRDIVGLVWYVLAAHHFDLQKDAAYERCVDLMEKGVNSEWQANVTLVEIPGMRSLMIRALMTAGRRSPQMDAAINGYVRSQTESGIWPLPRVLRIWGLDKPPANGIKMGTMDGANTYLLTLSLIHYRAVEFGQGQAARASSSQPPPQVPSGAMPADLETDTSPDAMAFKRTCKRCHILPSPYTYNKVEWPGVARKMQAYMGEQGLDVAQKDVALSLQYVTRHAFSAVRPPTTRSSSGDGKQPQ